MNKKIWAFIIIIAILIGAIFLVNQLLKNKTPAEVQPTEFENSLIVSLQDPNSVAVLVKEVSLSSPGFIAIQELNLPSSTLAVSDLLPAGNHKNIPIIMDFEPSQSYYAVLYIDDGNGQFDQALDTPALDSQGSTVKTMFSISDTQFIGTEPDIKG